MQEYIQIRTLNKGEQWRILQVSNYSMPVYSMCPFCYTESQMQKLLFQK